MPTPFVPYIKISSNFPPLLATNVFHDSDANITFHLSEFFHRPSWQLMLFMTEMQILHSFHAFHFHDSDTNISFMKIPLLPCQVTFHFLHHLAQEILLIIALPGTDDAPRFLHHPEICGTEFWHAHLNYACTRFAISHGSDRRLGNQICHWTTGSSETCMKVTHLVYFCRRRLAPMSSLNTVPRCLPHSAPLTMFLC